MAYIRNRLAALLRRYGLSSAKAEQRTKECVEFLQGYGCRPTFPTPGRIIAKSGEFCRELQQLGAEFAVHGYDHVDFRSLSPREAKKQFSEAANAFRNSGIQFEGFRCPYLSYTDALLDSADGMFKYSSNKAIWWDVVPPDSMRGATAVLKQLDKFYHPDSSSVAVAVPRRSGHLVEIPVSVPDDLQLYDGLQLGEAGLGEAWTEIVCKTHQRGELFVLMFHPESFEHCRPAFDRMLREAQRLRPAVWLTQLRDVSRWWWEKAGFTVNISADASGLHLTFNCSERATVLFKNLETQAPQHIWDGSYQVLESRKLDLPLKGRPFIGVSPDVPVTTLSFLEEQGYILDRSDQACGCGLYLDAGMIAELGTQVRLIEHIESSPAPLVRFWRWPDEAKSALCFSGDLDALSLMDYAARLFMV